MSKKSRRSDAGAPESSNRLISVGSKILVWGLFFACLYLLRSFFLLIFLTFVFAYIQSTGVDRLAEKIPSRPIRVTFAGLALLGVLIGITAFLVPSVKEQAKVFVDRFPSYIQHFDENILKLAQSQPLLRELIPELQDQLEQPDDHTGAHDFRKSPSALLFQQLMGLEENNGQQESPDVKPLLDTLRNVGGNVLGVTSAFLLSLLFSFLIVLDLPKLTQSVQALEHTKVGFIYREVATSIRDFGRVLGRALEAQLFIALANTVLTAIGISLLRLGGKAAFLSLIVFFCSFIPVAGVFISSVPICLVALQERGITVMTLAIAMITIVHFIEAYILNPKIYGHHMRMNPVIVLIILTIGGKLFHVWGLILGVPVCTYIFGHAIRHPNDDLA